MKSDFAFKETQFYGWESEPKEERPTGFGNSTQWSSEWATVSGEDGADRCGLRRPRQAARPRLSVGFWLGSLASVMTLGVVALVGLMHLLHH